MSGKLNEGELARPQKIGRRSTKRKSMHPTLFKKLSSFCTVKNVAKNFFS